LASDNLIGVSQNNKFLFQSLSKVTVSSYQCSESTTASEVSQLFKRAEERQTNFDRYQTEADVLVHQERCCVFLDEVGLPKEKRQALKAMHDVLDNWKGVPVILLSNKNLDAAKMSRCLQVMQTQPSKQDLEKLTLGLLYENDHDISYGEDRVGARRLSEEEHIRIQGLCQAFDRINSLIPSERGFHLRDFVYLLKSLRRSLVDKEPGVLYRDGHVLFDASILLKGLRRNFQTVNPSNFSIVAKEFLRSCRLCDYDEHGIDWYSPHLLTPQVLSSLKASIEDKHPEGEDADPTTAPFRHTLLIDRSNCESAIDLLFSMNVLDANETRVLTMPSNDIDQNSIDISEALRHVKNAAENGLTMLLVNGDALYSALYDLLNKYYNSGGGKEYFCNINLGAVSSPVSVHSKFKLVVYISAEKVQTAPLPFLNRFSKFALSFHDALQDRVEFYKQPDNKPPCFYSEPPDNIELLFKGLVAGGEDFANYLGGASAIYGFLQNETVPALCLKVLMDACSMRTFRIQSSLRISGNDEDHTNHSQDSLAQAPDSIMIGDLKDRMPEFIRAINFQILQLARPESVFNLRGRLPREYIEEYFRQEHFSFVNIVRHVMLLPWDGSNSNIKVTAFTRTNTAIKLLRTTENLDKLKSLFQSDSVSMLLSGQNITLSESSFICILCAEAFLSGVSQIADTIHHFLNQCSLPPVTDEKTRATSKVLLVIFDMSIHSSSFVSFLRRKIDENLEVLKTKIPPNYRMPSVILLLHVPPEMLNFRASYNALSTNNWLAVYTDTFGIEQCELEGEQQRSSIDPRRWLQVAFRLSEQPAVETVRSELGESIFASIREALRKISYFQEELRKPLRIGVQKSTPAYTERNSAKAADWIYGVFEKRPYLKTALLDNYASFWGSLLEKTAEVICFQISRGQTVS
jgi:hypothetical protein